MSREPRQDPPSATFVGMPAFPEAARAALADTQLRHNLAHATTTIRDKRAAVVAEVRGLGGAAPGRRGDQGRALRRPRRRTCCSSRPSLTAAGATVHWARDAAEATRDRRRGREAHGVDEVVKVKSMATQEIELNEALAAEGIAAWETDLAELIVQLGDDLPSHILVPAIHRNRAEIREIFLRQMAAVGKPPRPT